MQLKEYLNFHNISQIEFAQRIQVSRMSITDYILYGRTPRYKIMQRIYEATGGLVSPNDFINISSKHKVNSKSLSKSKQKMQYAQLLSTFREQIKELGLELSIINDWLGIDLHRNTVLAKFKNIGKPFTKAEITIIRCNIQRISLENELKIDTATFAKDFAQARTLFEKKGIRLKELAYALGKTEATWHNKLMGKTSLSKDELSQLHSFVTNHT